MKPGTPVIVTWIDPNMDTDASGLAAEIDAEDLETATTASVGFWVKEEGGWVVIATDLYPLAKKTPTFRCVQRVQRVLIKRIQRLR